MKSHIRRLCVAGTMFSPFMLACPAYSQSVDPNAVTPQDQASGNPMNQEIIVTARKRSERLQDVPVAITAVNSATIQTYALNDIASISKLTPQLQVSVGGPSGGAQLYLRGVGSTANSGFDPAVGLVIDGVFYNRTLWLTQSFIDMANVEVLKGPQTLYFGKNTPAGVVMVETANPGNKTEGGVKAGYEFAARERFVEAFVSTPLTDTLGVRVVGRFSEMDGWIKALGETRPAGDPNGLILPAPTDTRLPGIRDISGRITLRWQPSSKFTATLKVSGTSYRDAGLSSNVQIFSCHGPNGTAQPQFGVLSPYDDCKPSDSVGRQNYPNSFVQGWSGFKHGNRQYSTLESYAISLNATYDFGWGNLNSVTGYNRYQLDGVGDASYSGTLQYLATDNTKNTAFSEEIRLLTTLPGPVNFLVGGFFQDARLTPIIGGRINAAGPDPTTGNWLSYLSYGHQSGQTYSAFGEITWKILPNLELSGGARFTHETKDSTKYNIYVNANAAAAFAPVGRPYSAVTEADNLSPQATISWHPVPDVTLYGSYKQGFKGGGYSFSSLLSPATRIDQITFRPEKARGFEAGAKATLFDRRLSLDLSVYNYLYSDLQVTAYDAATTAFTIQNAASSRIKGVEVGGRLQVSDAFQLRGNAAYNHARFVDFFGQCYAGQTIQQGCSLRPSPTTGIPTSQNLSGKRPPLAPDWNVNLGATWRKADLIGNTGLQLTVDGRYSSRYPLDSTNRPDMFQEAFATLDASIRIFGPDEHWALSLIGRNLTNQAITLTGADRPGTGGPSGLDQSNPNAGRLADGRGTVDRLRSVMVQASYKF